MFSQLSTLLSQVTGFLFFQRENTTDWIESHCDTINQEVTVELEKDVEFAENNTELTEGMKNNSCPGKCSGNGQCIAGNCEMPVSIFLK